MLLFYMLSSDGGLLINLEIARNNLAALVEEENKLRWAVYSPSLVESDSKNGQRPNPSASMRANRIFWWGGGGGGAGVQAKSILRACAPLLSLVVFCHIASIALREHAVLDLNAGLVC